MARKQPNSPEQKAKLGGKKHEVELGQEFPQGEHKRAQGAKARKNK
ncbi:hypothetical protein LC040_08065 [Bacillus tianshenii]|nr:hypothetical protein LC040_08065 [Bacillus tianshenii]